MIIQVKIILTAIIVSMISGVGLDFLEDMQWLWEINRVIFLLSITTIVGTLIWWIWI